MHKIQIVAFYFFQQCVSLILPFVFLRGLRGTGYIFSFPAKTVK
jgi:hypothetical protein